MANSLGGRVAVHGYSPWMSLYSEAKRQQLHHALQWVCRAALPVTAFKRGAKIVPFVKASEDGKDVMIVLVNANYDPTGIFEAEMAIPLDRLYTLDHSGAATVVPDDCIRRENDKTIVTIDNIEPWDFIVLTTVM